MFQGLLKIKLLPRLRYILEVFRPSPPVVQDVLQILTRIARHSSVSATQVTTTKATATLNCDLSNTLAVQLTMAVHIFTWSNVVRLHFTRRCSIVLA